MRCLPDIPRPSPGDELMTGEAPAPGELRRFISVKPVLDFNALQPGAAASDTIRKTAE